MNTATKVLDGAALFRGNITQIRMTKQGCILVALVLAMLISALLVVYIKNEQRTLFSRLQQLRSQANQLQVERGQLLLEKTSLATPFRLHQIASEQLNMHLPRHKQTLIMSE